MKNWWDIISIDKGADLRAIKRAYAKKLKAICQDENPAEFMELRAAYENAQDHIRYSQSNSDAAEFTLTIDANGAPHNTPDLELGETNPPTPSPPEIMDDVEALLKSPWGGSSLEGWQTILDDERLDSIDDFTDFERQLFGFILASNGYYEDEDAAQDAPNITPAIANLIFTHFNWHKNKAATHELGWLTKRLGVTLLGNNTPNWFARDTNSFDNTRNKKPSPDKFTNWFDNKSGKYIVFGILALLFIAATSSDFMSKDITSTSPPSDITLNETAEPNILDINAPSLFKSLSADCPLAEIYDIPDFNYQGPETLAEIYERKLKNADTPNPNLSFGDKKLRIERLRLDPELENLLARKCQQHSNELDTVLENIKTQQ